MIMLRRDPLPSCPSPREAGRGRDPARQRWEGEVWLLRSIGSAIDTHLTRLPLRVSRPLPPQAGGEALEMDPI
jgi:hypothetical protein